MVELSSPDAAPEVNPSSFNDRLRCYDLSYWA